MTVMAWGLMWAGGVVGGWAQEAEAEARRWLEALRDGEATVERAQIVREAEAWRERLAETGVEGKLRGNLAVELSWEYRVQSEYALAEARAREAAALGERLEEPRLQADGLNALGGVFWRRGDLATVWEHWLQAMRLREAAGDQAGVAASLSNLGILLDSEGDFAGALEYYQRALEIDRAIGSAPLEVASTLNNIGAVHEQMNREEAALSYHREALALRETTGDVREIAISYNNVGASLVDLGRLDEGREALQRSLEMRRAIGDRPGEASTLGELGKLERLAGNLDLAELHAAAGLAIYVEIAEPWGEADVANQLGEIALAAGEPELALEYFERARERAEQVGGPLLLAEQWDGRARALEAMGRWEDALAALREHAALREQIVGDASRRRVELLEIRHDTQQRELEVTRLRTANERAAQELAQARFERQAMVVGATGLVVFVMGLGWAWRRQRQATREAREAHARLRALGEQKDQFLRIVAHDLRGPLGNVRWMAGLLREDATEIPEARRLSTMIDEVAGRLVATTDRLLDLDRIESGAVQPEWQDVAPGEVARKVVAQYAAAARGKDLQLEVVGDESSLSEVVRSDARLTEQVLDNLVSNAVKFTPVGGRIEVRGCGTDTAVMVDVIDSGPGIPPEARERLFARFAQVGNKPTAGEGSHGLGLAIAHGLAAAMGAELRYETSTHPLGGAWFSVRFPQRAAAAPGEAS
ncbi:tetratricopeptide repeat protein [Actomonas aquatica]|uniref:histidine kinase n=1 Tax=Actomonas aquatica TaxID=2866162 RepID=A0ABZ1C904_9BACT|nr:tetratricopeptide repeat protein [Opitutus sp. WL0086]WRQ87743.1 tetratricopeptide repeat protein [Opitutus sp. WL0086]